MRNLQLTVEELHCLAPKMPIDRIADYILAMERICDDFNINTPARISAFITTVIVVSNQFRRGRQIYINEYPRYMRKAQYRGQYDKIPQSTTEIQRTQLFNYIYGANKELGNSEITDGWDYRGAFFCPILGRYAITDFLSYARDYIGANEYPEQELDFDDVKAVEDNALVNILSIAREWNSQNCSVLADKGKIEFILSRICPDKPQVKKALKLMKAIYELYHDHKLISQQD